MLIFAVSALLGPGRFLSPYGLGARWHELCLLQAGQAAPPAVPGALPQAGRLPPPDLQHIQSGHIQVQEPSNKSAVVAWFITLDLRCSEHNFSAHIYFNCQWF